MTTPSYDVGDMRRLGVAFADSAGTAVDPTTVTFTIRAPSGTVTSYTYGTDAELVKTGTGAYYVDWTIAAAGRYAYRFAGSGDITTAEGDEFYARRNESAG